MNINLAYGRTGLNVSLPDTLDVIQPSFIEGLSDEADAIRQAIRAPYKSPPLVELVKPGMKIAITHSDITRATPNCRILPVLLAELESAGVARHDVTLINALGTHRQQTESELRTLLGDYIVDHYRCIQHDAYNDQNLVSLGVTSFGHPVRLNRILLEADLKILTGFIEPHFFAGFSGGPKAVLPALAGAESVLTNHGVEMIGHPSATWGVTEGNPIWEEMCEMAHKVKPVFILNVALNNKKQITAVFAGDLFPAHTAGCRFVRQHAMIKVSAPYDGVVTTNSGYPLDQNLYQTVKGMSAASQIVRPGGAILMVAACEDGLPDHGQYANLLKQAGSIQGILEMLSRPGFNAQDQWQIQVQAMVQQKADVFVFSQGLSEKQISQALFRPSKNIAASVKHIIDHYGPRVCVLPDGPLTIAYL